MPAFAVGLGWMLSTSNQAEIVWHSSGTGGFRSYVGFNSKLKKGVAILSNSTEDWPDEFGLVVLDPDYKRPSIDKSLANDPEYLNQFAGSYTAILPGGLPEQVLTISVFGKLLGSMFSGGEVGMLYPESPGVFGVKGFPDGKVFFSFDETGRIAKVEARFTSSGTLLWAVPMKVKSPMRDEAEKCSKIILCESSNSWFICSAESQVNTKKLESKCELLYATC
jgi:hypothetical protein